MLAVEMAKTKENPAGVGVNEEQRLYLIPCGDDGSFSCYGFDVLQRKAQALAFWLGKEPPIAQPGTLKFYYDYEKLSREASALCRQREIRCEIELSAQLIGLEGKTVAVIDRKGDEPRQFRVGKSTGWMPCHLELEPGEIGGMAAFRHYYKVTQLY